MSTPAQIKASVKYNRSRDNIMIRATKEEGRKIREAAAANGQSIQAFIMDVLRRVI